jgi:hypothetical protein
MLPIGLFIMPQYPPKDKTWEKNKFNEAINEND